MSPEQIALRARMATHARMAKYGGEYLTKNARVKQAENLNQKLIEQWGLNPKAKDFHERLSHARSLYYTQLINKRWKKVAK